MTQAAFALTDAPPPRKCRNCFGHVWWDRDGELLCSRCHPRPPAPRERSVPVEAPSIMQKMHITAPVVAPSLFVPSPVTSLALRPYQVEAKEAIEAYWKSGGKRALMMLPTGAGKTRVFAAVLEANLAGRRGLVVAHREELLDQAAQAIAAATGLSVGIEQADRKAGAAQVVIACLPTLVAGGGKRLQALRRDEIGIVVYDEAHHAASRTALQMLHHFGLAPDPDVFSVPDAEDEEEKAALTKRRQTAGRSRRKTIDGFHAAPDAPDLLGVTATPSRADKTGLEVAFDEIVYSRTIMELIELGWLCKVRGVRVEGGADLSKVKVTHGDFSEGSLSDEIDTPERNQLIVAAYHDHAPGQQTIVFCAGVKHAQHLAEAFRDAGVRADWVSGETATDPRRAIVAAYKAGQIQVLTNCSVFLEGFDSPGTSCIIMARPTKSSNLYTQAIGRGTRTAPGKECLTVIDVVDAYAKAGLSSANALFGLPPRFGNQPDLAEAAAAFAKQLELLGIPASLLGDSTDWQSVSRIASGIDPLRVAALDPVLAEVARFAWLCAPWGYALGVPGGSLGVVVDLLGNGEVRWQPKGERPETLVRHLSDREAVQWAEQWLEGAQPEARRLVAKDAAWRRSDDPPSEKQLNYCRWKRIHVPDGASKGLVANLIDAAKLKAAR